MKKNYIAEIGELSVFLELLKRGFEVYRANNKTQPGWDIVVINEHGTVKRIQVKTTILANKSTNNSVKLKDGFDFLIVVIIDESNKLHYYILSKEKAKEIQGDKKQFSITSFKNKEKQVLDEIKKYKNQWSKINDD